MRKIKVSEATGVVLDWLVAKCEGFQLPDMPHSLYDWFKAHGPRYSADWSQGGPIMDDAEIDTYLMERGSPLGWVAEITGTKFKGRGPTRLIAAMRCYVAFKLGDEVAVPEELLT